MRRSWLCAAVGIIGSLAATSSAATTISGIVYDGQVGPLTVAGSPYVVPASAWLTVPTGQTLTVEPGVEIRLDENALCEVYGRLSAVGTATSPIRLTTHVAGKTWFSLLFRTGGRGQLRHTVIEDGGGPSTPLITLQSPDSVVIETTTVRRSHGSGLSGSIGTSSAGTLAIRGCTFDSNAAAGIYLTRGINATVTLAGNVMIQNVGSAYRLGPDLYPTGGTMTGNGFDGLDLFGGMTTVSGTYAHDVLINAQTSLVVGMASTLSFAPGITVRMHQNASIDVQGIVQAVGTPTARIRFVRYNAASAWAGVYLRAGCIADLRNCDFSGGGGSGSPMLVVQSPFLANVARSAFLQGSGDGLAGSVGVDGPGTLSVTQCTFSMNPLCGVRLTRGAQASVTLADNVFNSNGSAAYQLGPDLYPTGGSFGGNGFDGIVLNGGLTTVSGAYEHDLQLGGPFSPVVVGAGRVVTIRHGVTVHASVGSYVENYGTLVVEGQETSRVRLTRVTIIVREGGSTTLRYFDAELGGTPIVLQNPVSAVIEHATIRDNYQDGVSALIGTTAASSFTLKNSTVSGNGSFGCNLSLGAQATVSITCNAFTGNNTGLYVMNAGAATVRWNAFFGNSYAGVDKNGLGGLDVTNNYWGSPSGPDSIGPGSGDHIFNSNPTTSVAYSPWATAWDFPGCEEGQLPQADLALTHTVLPGVGTLGDSLHFTLVARNLGPADAEGVVVRDSLSPGLTLASVESPGVSCSSAAGIVTCALGTLAPGGSAVVMVHAVGGVGQHSAHAKVSASTADPGTANNESTASANVLGAPTDPYVSGTSPSQLLQGAPRVVIVDGGNFAVNDTAFRIVLTRNGRMPDPGDVPGRILSASASTIVVEFDVTSSDVLGPWDVEARNPGGASGHATISVLPSVIFSAMQFGGTQGFPVVPNGSFRTNYLDVGMIGNDDGFAILAIHPPLPGIINCKVGDFWDSRTEADNTRAIVVVRMVKQQVRRIPLHWGVPPERVIFGPPGPAASFRTLDGDDDLVVFGSDQRLTVDGLKGATLEQFKGILKKAIADVVCGGIADVVSGANRSALDIAVNSAVEGLPQNFAGTPKYFVDQAFDALAGLIPGYSLATMAASCMKEIHDAIFNTVRQEGKAAADRLRAAMGNPDRNEVVAVFEQMQDNGAQTYYVNRVVNNDGGVIEQLQTQPCSSSPGTSATGSGRIRGPFDPNDKYSTGDYVPVTEADGDTTREVLMIPVSLANEPIAYRITFENLAQALDSASVVTLRDTLDTDLDPTTVACDSAASIPMRGDMSWSVSGNVLTVVFDAIQLPPNVAPPEGEWQFAFQVRPHLGRPIGTEIRNRASIVFDFNPPILTPETLHRIGAPEIATGTPSIDLGNVVVEQPATAVARVVNAGSVPLDVWSLGELEAPFVVAADSCSGRSLAPGDSCAVTLGFTPTGVGVFSDTLEIQSSDVIHFPLEIGVHGTGTQPQSASGSVPLRFALHPCFPNPVRRFAILRYDLPRRSRVTLRLYDVVGRRVATLVSGVEDAGAKQVRFDASRISSGIYFCQFEAEEYRDVKALVRVR